MLIYKDTTLGKVVSYEQKLEWPTMTKHIETIWITNAYEEMYDGLPHITNNVH